MRGGVERLRCSRWGAQPADEVIVEPSWPDVERAIRRLDGADFNDLYLERPADETWLAIGGGAGRYFVMLTTGAQTETESWLVARRDVADEGDDDVSLVVGGQAGDYPARQVVEIETAFDAAHEYFATGEPSPAVAWERT